MNKEHRAIGFVGFDLKYRVLVDEQGIMLPMAEVDSLIKFLSYAIEDHKKHSALELEAIGRKTVEENHPDMVNQFNFDYFKD